MPLSDHLITDRMADLEQLLRSRDYHLYIKVLKTGGDFYFRVQDQQNLVLARSPSFPDRQARDAAYEDFIDYVETEIHKRRQRRLFF